jgi:Domain of unknown function (DUF4203)
MTMPLPFAILLIAFGLALVTFGLYLFYAWLPLFYGLFGFEIGFLLGDRLVGYGGSAAIALAAILGIIFAAATYVLEPYGRIVIGYLGGSLVALALLGLDRSTGGIVVAVVAVCGGVAGALLAARFFDYFLIATTALGGAALSSLGAQSLLFGASGGRRMEVILTVALAAAGVGFQLRHLPSWMPAPPLTRARPESVRHEAESRGRGP